MRNILRISRFVDRKPGINSLGDCLYSEKQSIARQWLFLLWLVIWLAGCVPTGPDSTPEALAEQVSYPPATTTPVATPTMFLTPTRRPTAMVTPTLTYTPEVLVEAGEELPAEMPPLMLENAAQASGLAIWYDSQVTDMDWLPGTTLLAVANGETISLYDVRTRQIRRTLYPQRTGVVEVAIHPNAGWLVAGSLQGSDSQGYISALELWRGPDWKPLGVMYGSPRGLTSLEFSAHGKLLAGAFASPIYEQNSVELWSTHTWVITGTVAMGPALDLAFSPTADILAVSPDRYALKIRDLGKDNWLFTLHTSFTGAVNRLVFSPDGMTLASGHYDGTIRFWDMRSGNLLYTIQTDEVIESLAFSPDGRMLATGGSYSNHLVRLWDTHSGALLRSLIGHTSGVSQVLFSPDGLYLVSASYDGMLRLWGIRP